MTVIDDYLQKVENPKREALERIRILAKKFVPDATEAISYAMPTLKYQGKPFLGFDARKNYIGLYPYSSEVIAKLEDELHEYTTTKGAIHVPLDRPIPEELLKHIVDCRLELIKTK